MGPLGESLAAWVLLPALLYAVALGLGLLACRLARFRPPNAVVPPIGLAVALVAGLPLYRLDLGAWPSAVALGIGALVGFALSRRELRARVNPGPAGAAALVVFALYLAPVVLSGGWTWTGYNFVNDTAVQLELSDHLAHHGFSDPVAAERIAKSASTSDATVYAYLHTYYPVGTHALLATAGLGVPAPTAALYQPFIAMLAAFGAMAIACLIGRITASQALAALAAAVAVASNLLYVYALQGNLKEVAAFATLAVAAAVGRELLADVRLGPSALFGLCLAALLAVYSAAGAPYVVGLGLTVLGVALLRAPRGRRARLWRPALVSAGALALGTLLAAADVIRSFRVINHAFGSGAGGKPSDFEAAGGVASELGQLVRPLPLQQAAGVWLGDDYRLPVSQGAELWNTLGIAGVALLASLGLYLLWRRHEGGLLLLLVPAVAAVLLVGPRVSPYAAAKLLAIASPAIVALAALGPLVLARRSRPLGWIAGTAVLATILVSDAFAYHSVRLAPTQRMLAMQDVADRYQHRGELLVTDQDEFVKYFMRDALNVSIFDPISPRQVALRKPQFYVGRPFDLDDMTLTFLESAPWLVQRNGPEASRPPANFSLDYKNRFYSVWRRGARPRVLAHLPLQRIHNPTDKPVCADVLRLAGRARGRDHLVAARGKRLLRLEPSLDPHRSPGWPQHGVLKLTVTPKTPGQVSGRVRTRGGNYRVWVQGSFGRPIAAYVGGRRVGQVEGVNTPGQWHLVGEVTVPPGPLELKMRRGPGGLAPGDGFGGDLGPLALEPAGRRTLVSVRPRDARRLCGREWDWIEWVRDDV